MTTRITMLREATRDAHHSIETVPALARLLADDVTRDEYIMTLRYLHSFHAAIEPLMAAQLSDNAQALLFLTDERIRLLSDDLTWFHATTIAPPILSMDSADAALGGLYVLEGSARGARSIARHLIPLLNIGPGQGGSFFCRSEPAHRWRHLSDLVNQAEADDDAVIAGAQTMFQAYGDWMRLCPTPPCADARP